MNERIKALLESMGLEVAVYDSDNYCGQGFDFEGFRIFAELIVKECIDITLKSGSVHNKSEQAKAEADRIYHKIKEHFGVEE